ncbi:MAG: hypothetical protein ACTSPG_04285 [Candidatus Hodarchaeales archaeon]
MLNRRDRKRILIVGSDVGSLSKALRNYNPNYEIGAIEILGNIETRKYAKWKFSVAKQSPGLSISVPQNRSLTNYLIELTYVMLEEIEFDIILPCSPLHTEKEFLIDLKHDYNIYFPSIKTIDLFSSDYTFLQTIKRKIQNLIPSAFNIHENLVHNIEKTNYFFATKRNTEFFSSFRNDSVTNNKQDGFLIPCPQLYSAAFIQKKNFQLYLGIQELKNPYNKDSLVFPFENNALTPPNIAVLQNKSEIIDKLKELTSSLGLSGFFTIYFTLNPSNDPIPLSLVPTFDQNIIIWQLNTQSLVLDLLNNNINQDDLKNFLSFKLPIYSHLPTVVQDLKFNYVIHQNIPRVISSIRFPLCSVVGAGKTYEETESLMIKERDTVLKKLSLV